MNSEMQESSPADFLAGKFQYESDFQTASPSTNYFWFRKRLQVKDLIHSNINRLASVCGESKKLRIVDVGCGDGTDLFLIREVLKTHFSKSEYLGLEGSPLSYQVCNLRKSYFHADNILFEIADLTLKLPLADHSIDFVYCSEVVEHLPEPEILFKEIRRILKPKGLLLLTTPNEPNVFQRSFWFKKARLRLEEGKQLLRESPDICQLNGENIEVYGHISCRTNQEWDKSLENEGFSLVDYRRGGIIYGGNKFYDQNIILSLRFLIEAILDTMPKSLTRSFSDQLISLYSVQS